MRSSRAQKMHLFHTEQNNEKEKFKLRNQTQSVFDHVCMCHEHLAQADGCKFNARRNIYDCSTQDFNVQWYMFICSSVFLLLLLQLSLFTRHRCG